MGTAFTQSSNSLFSITTPLGQDKVLLRGFRGSEGMSRLFRFELDLLSEDQGITFTDIVGKNVTISVLQADGTPRYFNGVISRFGQGAAEGVFATYHAEMVPWLWFLTRDANCRIFQNMAIPDIITKVFSDAGQTAYKNSVTATYPTREYCVQYRETDFNFVSRLMEEYGIYYFFTHDNGQHTLVMGDAPSNNADCPGQNQFKLYTESTAVLDEDVIQSWQIEQELRTGKYSLTDYNFLTPSSNLLASTTTVDVVGGNTSYNTYDYPGKYLTQGDGSTLVKTRMEEEESVHLVAHGTSDARSLVTGYKFTLQEHYRDDLNQPYLLTDIDHVATTTSYGSSRGEQRDHYSNSFRCIPASVPFRPLRVTPHPTIMGPQPAVVVGPSGEEIYTDKYGRIKVQFFWDQVGTKDENSSCWIRVAHAWAGKQWGIIYIPRIGQEVMVDFLEGDPDQPLVVGRVYNADQMPPYTLPDNMTQSGILTRSSKGGTADNFNQLRFEDKKGSEEIYFHAEKDKNIVVENNETLTVGSSNSNTSPDGSRTHTVYNNDSLTVTQGNRTISVNTGNETHTIKQGNQTLTVSQGNQTISVSQGNQTINIGQGNRTVSIGQGNDKLTVSEGNITISASAGAISVTAMQSITLTCGQSKIALSPSGITISSSQISISGEASCAITTAQMSISADATCTISSDGTMSVTAVGPLSLTGAMTSINS
jgi:type VI secretion system secreted protein VgrG